MRSTRALALGCVLALAPTAGCDKHDKTGKTTTTSDEVPKAASGPTAVEEKHTAHAPPPASVSPVITWKAVGLSAPFAVIQDEVADQYIVSNVDGDQLEADGQGFISKLLPDGKRLLLKWIESGKGKVKLNAPKGMAIRGEELYVADLDTVRVFNRRTGAPIADLKIPSAIALSAVALAPDGRILVVDSGVKIKRGTERPEPSGTDAVYAIDQERKVTPIVWTWLGGPSAILPTPNKLWTVAFGSGELYSIEGGRAVDVHKLPKGSLVGLAPMGDEMLISSWAGGAIYRGKPGGEWKAVIEDLQAPASIAYDRKRGRVLVPLFTTDEVREYDLK